MKSEYTINKIVKNSDCCVGESRRGFTEAKESMSSDLTKNIL